MIIETFATKMERSLRVDVESVDVRPVLKQTENDFIVSLPSGPVEEGSSCHSRFIDVGAVLEEEVGDIRDPVHDGPEEGSFSEAVDRIQIEVLQ